MKRKIIVSVLGMTMAVAMMTGCGSGSSSSTKTADSTAVESEEVQVADAEEVDSTDDASDTEEVTDSNDTGVSEEPAEAEPAEETTVEGLDEKPDIDDHTFCLIRNLLECTVDGESDARDANGTSINDVEPMVRYFDNYYDNGAYTFYDKNCEDFSYVAVDGERWIQFTITVPEGATTRDGMPLPEHEDTYTFTFSPDFTKMMYKGVIYTPPADSPNFTRLNEEQE